jgi:hypothetical protein
LENGKTKPYIKTDLLPAILQDLGLWLNGKLVFLLQINIEHSIVSTFIF